MQAVLREIDYQHLGGEVVEEGVSGDTAIVTLHGRIAALDGISTQTERYRLKRIEGRWLIDTLEVRDEVVPKGKNPHPF